MRLWFIRIFRILPWIHTKSLSATVKKITDDRSPGWAKYIFDIPLSLSRSDLASFVEAFLKKRRVDFHCHPEEGAIEIVLPCPICPFNTPPKFSIERDGADRLRLMFHIPTVGLSAWTSDGDDSPPSWDSFVRELDAFLWGTE